MKSIVYMFLCIIIGINRLHAQSNLPGDTTLPSSKYELLEVASLEKGEYKYSVEDFIQTPKQFDFRLSPDGQYLSFKERDNNGKIHISVKNIETDSISQVIQENKEIIGDYGWISGNRFYYMMDNGGDENYHLYAVDIDGKNQIDLTPYGKVQVSVLSEIESFLIIQMNKDNSQIYEPYKINFRTGELIKLFEITDPSKQIHSYNFDKDGNLKGYTQLLNDTDYVFYYRAASDKPFEKVIQTSSKDKFRIINFDYSSENPNDAYVLSNVDNNTTQILKYDLIEKRVLRKEFSNDTFDIEGLRLSSKRAYEIDYYSYIADRWVDVPVSKTFVRLFEKIGNRFGDMKVSVSNMTKNEDKCLLLAESDKIQGVYYLYDIAHDTFKELFNLRPNLKEEDMARVLPITFKSRDGLVLHGYLTLPKQVEQSQKVPLILHPHGGPSYVRNIWCFDSEQQLFANRGYATLQINFRGSSGYGKQFVKASFKEIGRKMLNDLEDGIAYVKTLGYIDDNKIAIYGASYAGLATLQSLVKTPDLYACGVDYVGPSNLFSFFNSMPPYMKPRMQMLYDAWYDPNSIDEQEIIKQVSPLLNVDKIKKPIFVIQGANDSRVNINESDQIVRSLRTRGFEVPYMVKYNEGHGFRHEDNELEFYKTMLGFLAKHLKN